VSYWYLLIICFSIFFLIFIVTVYWLTYPHIDNINKSTIMVENETRYEMVDDFTYLCLHVIALSTHILRNIIKCVQSSHIDETISYVFWLIFNVCRLILITIDCWLSKSKSTEVYHSHQAQLLKKNVFYRKILFVLTEKIIYLTNNLWVKKENMTKASSLGFIDTNSQP